MQQDPFTHRAASEPRGHAGDAVRVVNLGMRDLSTGPLAESLGDFDPIYSAGLYDDLPDGLTRRLTRRPTRHLPRRLLQMLRPAGRLLIANFVPGGTGRGYIELFMDGSLILRKETAMRALGQASAASPVVSFHDPHRKVVYAELEREAAQT